MFIVYEKSGVNLAKLSLEIKGSDIASEYQHSIFSEPSDLKVHFVSDLTSADEATLDGIVSDHDGNAPTDFRMYCSDCGVLYFEEALSEPSECPTCSGSNIANIEDCYDAFCDDCKGILDAIVEGV